MAAFTSQRTGNWSNATSAGPWFVTGTGLPAGGHGTGGVPGAADTVTVATGHTVTVDTTQSVGLSTNSTNARDLVITGTLTIANNTTLTTYCCIGMNGGTLNLGPGSILSVDGTANAISYQIQPTAANNHVTAVGVSGNPCQINSVGTTLGTAGGVALNFLTVSQIMTFTYCNFTNYYVIPDGGTGGSAILTNCNFLNCACIAIQVTAVNSDHSCPLKLINCRFSGTTHSYCAQISLVSGLTGVTLGSRLIDGCSFDQTVYLITDGCGFVIQRSTFVSPILGLPFLVASGLPWVSFDSNLVKWTSVGSGMGIAGPITNCIFATDDIAHGDQQGASISTDIGPLITTSGSGTITVPAGASSLGVTAIPCNFPAGTTMQFGGASGVALTLTSPATLGDTSLSITSVAGGSFTAGAQCYVHVYMGNVYQSNTSGGINAPLFVATSFTPTKDTAITVKNNIMLPSIAAASPGASGQVFNSAKLPTHSFVTVEHNTCCRGNDPSYGAITLGDSAQQVSTQALIACRSNITYCPASSGMGTANWLIHVKSAQNNAATSTINIINPANLGYNASWQLASPSTTTFDSTSGSTLSASTFGYDSEPTGSIWLASTTISAAMTDLNNVNPQFVDMTYDLAKAYVSALGQTTSGVALTDWKATLSYLAGSSGVVATPTLIATVMAGIRGGFVPTAGSYNQTYPGDTSSITNLGAVQGSYPFRTTCFYATSRPQTKRSNPPGKLSISLAARACVAQQGPRHGLPAALPRPVRSKPAANFSGNQPARAVTAVVPRRFQLVNPRRTGDSLD
jgi:hypothetical protein